MAYGRHSGVSIRVWAKGASLSDMNLVALQEPGPFGFDIFRRQPIQVWWNTPVGTPCDLRYATRELGTRLPHAAL